MFYCCLTDLTYGRICYQDTSVIICEILCTRSTTEFAGWPSPSPSPISIEKLLQAAKEAATKETNTDAEVTTMPSTTTTSTTTTTTRRPTTPGICSHDCDLAGSLRLVSGVKWVPELLDHNTKEWRNLANEVQHQVNLLKIGFE